MFLSRIQLNANLRDTMRALSSPKIIHNTIVTSFLHSLDVDNERILWRVDYLGEKCFLLVLSAQQPDFKHIAERFGYPRNEPQWETKNYDLLLNRINTGQVWRFRLRANPVRSSSKEKDPISGRGKVFAHVTTEQQKQWLLSRAKNCGFLLNENEFDVVYTEWKKFNKGIDRSHEVSLRVSDFEGKLTIADVEIFKKVLLSGLGRAKAYGCGMMTIAGCESVCHE